MSFLSRFFVAAVAALSVYSTAAGATERLSTSGRSDQIVIRIDKSDQEMTVMQGGRRLFNWPVSTGWRCSST